MSGQDRPRDDDRQSSRERRQGADRERGGDQGQDRGRRETGGQARTPEQGQARPGRQDRRPPGGGSPTDTLRQPGPSGYLRGVVGTFAVSGLLLGLLSVVLGRVGGFPIVPQAVKTAQQLASGLDGAAAATSGPSPSQALSQGLSTTYAALHVYIPNLVAPFVALTLTVVLAVVVATRLQEDAGDKLVTAAASTGVGAFVFMLLSTVVLGVLAPSVPQSLLQASGTTGVTSFGSGIASLGTLQFGNLLINSLVVGVLCAVTAAGVVYAVENLLPASATA